MYIVNKKIMKTTSIFIAVATCTSTVANTNKNIELSVSSKNNITQHINNTNQDVDGFITLNHEWKFDIKGPNLVKSEGHVSKSERLRSDFGFGIKQWCAILGVARETHYKWLKKPETEMNSSTILKLMTMEKLSKVMEPEHRKFLSLLAFGRQSISSVAEELVKSDFNQDIVEDFYDSYYFKLEGLLKRSDA